MKNGNLRIASGCLLLACALEFWGAADRRREKERGQ